MQENIKNRTIFCRDNIHIFYGLDSNSIDLIYLDPPFNKKKMFTAPIGSSADGASFLDIFTMEDVKDEWLLTIKEDYYAIHELLNAVKNIEGRKSYNFCYLAYMAIRLMEIKRILKSEGSVYLHCDSTMSHYLKMVMDCIFGEINFRNEIVWHYPNSGLKAKSKKFHQVTDVILYYVKDINAEFTFNHVHKKRKDGQSKQAKRKFNPVTKKADMVRDEEGKIIYIVRDEVLVNSMWEISSLTNNKKEGLGYPTQKPLTLLERIIKTSSEEGDIVLDPFCGCATTCVAAEKLNRKWIGIDVSVKAYDLVKKRLAKEVEHEGTLFHEELVSFQTDAPKRTDTDSDAQEQKYVYIISHQKYPDEYKVGIASNVTSRLSAYQTADPDRAYQLEYSFQTPHFRAIEKHIHTKYDNKHEWVRGDMQDIIKDIEGYSIKIR